VMGAIHNRKCLYSESSGCGRMDGLFWRSDAMLLPVIVLMVMHGFVPHSPDRGRIVQYCDAVSYDGGISR